MSSNGLIEILENVRSIREAVNRDLDGIEARIRNLIPQGELRRYARLRSTDWRSDMRTLVGKNITKSQQKNALRDVKKESRRAV